MAKISSAHNTVHSVFISDGLIPPQGELWRENGKLNLYFPFTSLLGNHGDYSSNLFIDTKEMCKRKNLRSVLY